MTTSETIADAVTAQVDAETAATDAAAQLDTAQAAETSVAAAGAAVALAETQAAATMQEAAATIRSTEENQQWLETQLGMLSTELANYPSQTQAMIQAETAPLKAAILEVAGMVSALTLPTSPPNSESAVGSADAVDPMVVQNQSATANQSEARKRQIRHV